MAQFVEELGRYNQWTLTPLEWQKRFRIGKDPISELCDDFWASEFCTTRTRQARKTVLGYDERVSTLL